MRRLSDDLDQLFGELIGASDTGRRGAFPYASPLLSQAVDWIPALDLSERDGELVVQTDLPGVAPQDVKVEVIDGVLQVSGERREEREEKGDGLRRTERRYGRFLRTITLPDNVRPEDIRATFRDGVLEVRVPMQQSSQRRQIEIQNAGSEAAGTQTGQQQTSQQRTGAAAERPRADREREARERTGAATGASGSTSAST